MVSVIASTPPTMRRALLFFTLLFTGMGVVLAAAPINTLEKTLIGFKPNGIAIRGYDTVAYFTQGEAVEGVSDYTTVWMEVTWQFSSQENLNSFLETRNALHRNTGATVRMEYPRAVW